MLYKQNSNHQIAFKGFANVEPIADRQIGPTCGFEAIENIIQLFKNTSNTLTENDLQPRACRYGFAIKGTSGYSLDIAGYVPILADYGISARWYPFDHLRVVIPALQENRGVLLIGDAHCLNPQAYHGPESWHAFLITNYYTDETQIYVLGYIGIDSNFSYQQTPWSYQNVEAAVTHAAQRIMSCPVLITDTPGNWPMTARFYRLGRDGHLVPMR